MNFVVGWGRNENEQSNEINKFKAKLLNLIDSIRTVVRS